FRDRAAVQLEDRTLTYGDLHDRVVRVAAMLRDLGIEKQDRVAVLMLNSHRYLELYYATALTGVMMVPLNIRWNAAEISSTLQDSGAKLLAVDERFLPLCAGLRLE